MYARYRSRSKFYKRPESALRAYGVNPNLLRRPKVKAGLLHGIYKDERIDLRDKERLDLVESIRHPKERDFYQDHTYHNQWIARDLEKAQKQQLSARYRFFAPDFAAAHEPWCFFPGDTVEVVKGEGVGQRGAIIAVVRYKNEVVVQNVNVQDVVIPASETRPEQTVQREHPISVDRVRHVDPSTNELCHLDVVTVRDRATGELVKKRISLETGVMLPLPSERSTEAVEVGDPLRDTPIADADEPTYDRAKEIPLLSDKKLQAMENYFVSHRLKSSYEYHSALSRKNAEQMAAFQVGVVQSAADKLAARIVAQLRGPPAAHVAAADSAEHASVAPATPLPAWWSDTLAAQVAELREEEAARAAEEATQAQQEAQERGADGRMTSDVGDLGEEEEDLDGELDDAEDGTARA